MGASGTLVIRFIGDLKEFERATGSLSKKLTGAGRMMTKNLTLPLVGIGVAAAKGAMDFEKSMSLIQGLVGASDKQIRAYSKTILTQGPKWGKSPQELADALYFVTSSGFQGAKALDILEKSAKASTAGLGEATDVADLLTSAMNAYRKSGLNAADATDILANAVKLGKLEPADLAQVMGQVLPVASSMGVQFDEVAAALSSMSLSGTDASEGTTQLRGILSALLKPTIGANKALSSVGLTAQGLREQIKKKGLLSVLETLSTKFHGNTAAIAAVFGNVRALTGVMNMMGQNVGQTRKVFDEMGHSTGQLDKAFSAAQKTTKFKLDKAISQIKASLIILGGDILPMVATGLDRVTGWVSKGTAMWQKLSPEMRKVVLVGAGIVAAVGPMLLVFGKVLFIVSKLTPQFGLVMLAVAALVAVFTHARSQTGSFGEAMRKIASFFTDGKFAASVAKLREAFSRFISSMLPTLRQVGKEIAQALVPAFAAIARLLREVVIPAFVAIMPVVGPILRFLIKMLGSAIVGALKGAAQFLNGFIDTLVGIFKLVDALIHGRWHKAWLALLQILRGVLNMVIGGLKVWFNVGILGIFKHGVLAVLKSWKGLWEGAGKLAKSAWKGLTGLWSKGTTALTRLLVGAVKGYLSLWGKALKGLLSLAVKGWKGLRGAFSGALSAIRKLVADGVKFLVSRFRTGMTTLKNVITHPIDTIRKIFGRLMDLVRTTVPKAFQSGVSAMGRIWKKLEAAAAKPVRFIVNTVYTEGIRRVVNAIPGVKDLPAVKFAHGGPVFGGQRGKDSVKALLMPGEHVWTADEVKAAGGHKVIEFLRRAVAAGGLGRLFDPPAMFAKGGAIDPDKIQRAKSFANAQVGKPYVWGGVGPNGYDCSGFMSAITNVLRGKRPFSRVGATGSFPWPGFRPGPGQFTIGSARRYPGSSVGHMAGTLAGMNVESRGGNGPIVGPSARGYNDPGFNTVGHLGIGGKAAAQSGGFFDAVKSIKNLISKAGGWFSELSHMGGWGGLIKEMAKSVVGSVRDWATDKIPGLGKLLHLFDSGGLLMPGMLGVNRTGMPERVLDPQTTKNFATLTAALNTIMRGDIGRVAATRPWSSSSGMVTNPVAGNGPGDDTGRVVVHQHFPTSADPKAAARASADRLVARLT